MMTPMKRITVIALAAGLALAGCSKKSPTTTPDPNDPNEKEAVEKEVAAGPTCDSAADNIDRLLRAEMADRISGDQITELRGVVASHCTGDAWSAEAIACISDAASGDQIEGCEDTLTKEQSDAVDAEFERVMEGGGGTEEPPSDDEW
jgi:hypothetical protein